MTFILRLALVAGLFFLASCGSRFPELSSDGYTPTGPYKGIYKVGKPYQIQGVWYKPAEDPSYDKVGVASWYGPNFHGKSTANGDVFNKNALTAAHQTLPLPSLVRVTNLNNGRTIIVMVNDRGPFSRGRIIDVSRRAAEKLDFERAGTAKVRVQFLPKETAQLLQKLALKSGPVTQITSATPAPAPVHTEQALAAARNDHFDNYTAPAPVTSTPITSSTASRSTTSPAAAPSELDEALADASISQQPPQQQVQTQYQPLSYQTEYYTNKNDTAQSFVQVGAYLVAYNAETAKIKLASLGKVSVDPVQTNSGIVHRVRIGPIANRQEAEKLLRHVMDSGYPDAMITYQ